ncbi:excinuclease ABC subunit UvrB [Candidatus Nomurabacteria bacterium]|nr:excinuclease ABC subunit UvrB [Candidatus Nomurabacteria bacterium]
MDFQLVSKFKPAGDQEQAIKKLYQGLKNGHQAQTLLGVTGSGKTFTAANLIAQVNKPTLVISHNKTLAAQLASEFQDFFPHNAVHYFVSYYDYYQPEAYLPASDTYIEKETQINEEIDRLRHVSTQSLLTRSDVLIVASVSCIYNLGSPTEYQNYKLELKVNNIYNRPQILKQLNDLQYQRNDLNLVRGTYAVRGEIVEIFASGQEDQFYRLVFFGDHLEMIELVDLLNKKVQEKLTEIEIYPAKHFMTNKEDLLEIIKEIRRDLKKEVAAFEKQGNLVEAQRLDTRVRHDLEMISETGYCNGIENYSRYFSKRKIGDPPISLLEYFPDDFLVFIDESHMTIPQIRGMYAGDRARKENLVRFGFRLSAAFDNRPLKFAEFSKYLKKVIYVSATPADYEFENSQDVVEQLIRPTFILDPKIEIRSSAGQLDDLSQEIVKTVAKKQRVLATVLTKRLAEDLAELLQERGIKVQYLHSEVKTLDRIQILQDLRSGKYDVLVGVNLLREGLDLPEVSLVAILDADKEGFLRSKSAFIQLMGRAARHQDGRVIMYADKTTGSMSEAIKETTRRRKAQEKYNQEHKVSPLSIQKDLKEKSLKELDRQKTFAEQIKDFDQKTLKLLEKELNQKMNLAAENWQFEQAILYRDQLAEISKQKNRD